MTMPREWVRGVQWAAGARAEWEPILRAAQAAWSELELVSVSERLRTSALIHLEASEVSRAGADCARAGLTLSVLERAADGTFRAAVHAPGLAAEWYRAWAESDHDAIGRMLGFPDCCRAFFARAWAGTKDRDVTPAMGSVDGPWQANTMLRWLGVRLVPHLPCSADCAQTVANADAYLEMGARLAIDVAPLETLLRLPVTHDALNGVLIVSTPHFRFMAGGSRDRFTASRPAALRVPDVWTDVWTDNGFGSMAAMDRAHAVVMDVAGEVLSALDLGAGDGRLLWRLARLGGGFVGIESDPGRVERGNQRHGKVVSLVAARIEDADLSGQYDAVFLMPGRLLEMEPAQADRIRAALVGRRLVLYAYDDQLAKYGGLEGLAERAGLGIIGIAKSAPGVAAADGVVMGGER